VASGFDLTPRARRSRGAAWLPEAIEPTALLYALGAVGYFPFDGRE
jgi:hypothetical protein